MQIKVEKNEIIWQYDVKYIHVLFPDELDQRKLIVHVSRQIWKETELIGSEAFDDQPLEINLFGKVDPSIASAIDLLKEGIERALLDKALKKHTDARPFPPKSNK
ncbi:hypothetical protein QUB75_27015 [Microcoleus sp. K1-B6]|uniref:hypothetical protein n=1 Tax=unclassified Microcoleus TaxID=2642155 RepID=UPI002FD25AF8